MERSLNRLKIPKPSLTEGELGKLEALLNCPHLDLEIGAGHGLHAIQYALTNTQRTLLAIERTTNKFQSFLRRYKNHGHFENLVPLHADAISVLVHYLKDESLEKIFILYPNPYPKNSQRNLRFHNSSAFSEIIRCLKPKGELIFASNLHWYIEEAKSQILGTGSFALHEESNVFQGSVGRTHFERKYLKRGETCYHLMMKKVGPKTSLRSESPR